MLDEKDQERLRRSDHAFIERRPWETAWDEVYPVVIPERQHVSRDTIATGTGSKVQPAEIYRKTYDSTPILSASNLSNQLISGLIPPWFPWAQVRPSPLLDRESQDALAESFEFANDALFLMLNGSNLVREAQPAFLDLIVGTACLQIMPSEKGRGVSFTNIPIEELAIDEDSDAIVSYIYRKHAVKYRELLRNDKWMAAINAHDGTVGSKILDNPEDDAELLSIVEPGERQGFDMHVYLRQPSDILLETTRLPRNPYKVARWSKVSKHVYGRGPALISLGDSRSLNKVKELTLKYLARVMLGIWAARDDGIINPRNTSLRAGNILSVRSNDTANPSIRELPATGQFDAAQFGTEQLRQDVKESFLANQFSPGKTPQTAAEIIQRARVLSQNLGATYTRLESEWLVPIVTDSIEIGIEQGIIPAEASLKNDFADVVFLSQLAQAQRFQEVDNLVQFAGIVQQFSQTDPQAGLVLNLAEVEREIAQLMSIDSRFLRSEDEVDELVEASQQQIQDLNQAGVEENDGLLTAQGQPAA